MGKKKDDLDSIDRELAHARVELAEAILDSENSEQIIYALNELVLAQLELVKVKKKSGKKSAKLWKHSADEIFTILMCAVYRAQERE